MSENISADDIVKLSDDLFHRFCNDVAFIKHIKSNGWPKNVFIINPILRTLGEQYKMYCMADTLAEYISAGLITRVPRGRKKKANRKAVYYFTDLGKTILLMDKI